MTMYYATIYYTIDEKHQYFDGSTTKTHHYTDIYTCENVKEIFGGLKEFKNYIKRDLYSIVNCDCHDFGGVHNVDYYIYKIM